MLNSITLCARYLNIQDEQEQASREMLQIATENKDSWLEAFSLFLIGAILVDQQANVQAGRLAESSLRISEESGDLIGSIYALSVLGGAAFNLGEYGKSREYYLRFLSTSEKVGYRWAIANSSKYLGRVALAMDEIEEAEAYFHQSLRIAEDIGLGRDTINLLCEFARVRAAQEREEQAVELLTLVLEHPARRQTRWGEGRIRDSAQRILDELVVKLPSDIYATALERGQALELEDVVSTLLGEGNHG